MNHVRFLPGLSRRLSGLGRLVWRWSKQSPNRYKKPSIIFAELVCQFLHMSAKLFNAGLKEAISSHCTAKQSQDYRLRRTETPN
jgi:hypothetical protein